MNNLVKHVSNFINSDQLKVVIDYARAYDKEFKEFGNTEKEFTYHVNFQSAIIKQLLDSAGEAVYDFVCKNYKGPFEPFNPDKTHIARFGEGYGMHEHFDSTKPNDIATLIYLNDDYKGGEIYFPYLDINIKPKAGDLVCFPDTPDFVHGVKPIEAGIRYTSPRWITRIV